jgi:hypothetical protein
VPSLLIAGVLGGLLAPLPSNAAPASGAPTITLQMDAGTTLTINTTLLSTCSSGDTTLGYNYCYSVPTNQLVGTSPKQFRVESNGTPRVRIADKNGTDKMSLTGVRFVPVGSWPRTEVHTLTLKVKHTFNATTDPAGATINATNAGNTVWALRSSGEFNATTVVDSLNTPVDSQVTLTGTGTFSSANTNVAILSPSGTKNRNPLTFRISGPALTADINWGGLNNLDMGQEDPSYPQFDCRLGTSSACKPTIEQKLVATISGMDTLKVLSGPLDVFGALCSETFSAAQTKQIKFLKYAVSVLEFLLPQIRKPDLREKISDLISYLKRILVTTTTPPSDPDCPGAQVVAFEAALEAAVDGLVIISDNSSPGVPAPLHYYAVINAPGLTWDQARAAAKNIRTDCDLATITSAAEQAIITGVLPSPSGFDPEPAQDYWIGGEQIGEFSEPGGGWQWINGEGMFWNNEPTGMYANWGSTSTGPANEPNNLGGSENHLTVDHRWEWGWNDLNTDGANGTTNGYITEGTAGLCVPPVID